MHTLYAMQPMLASTPAAPLRFPLLCTPKVDGIRCLVSGRKARTRSGRPIPNRHIRKWIERHCPDGFDGELTVGTSFRETTSAVMTREGTPDFTFHVFDFVLGDCCDPYRERVDEMSRLEWAPVIDPEDADAPVPVSRIRFLLPVRIESQAVFDAYYAQCLAAGYEGVIARDPDGDYVPGRTSAREQTMLKVKPVADAEAEVLEAEGDEQLAALRVRWEGREFSIGTGFTSADRSALWKKRDTLRGQLVRFSYPIREGRPALNSCAFLGFRDPADV